jgi:hypothetical protein
MQTIRKDAISVLNTRLTLTENKLGLNQTSFFLLVLWIVAQKTGLRIH